MWWCFQVASSNVRGMKDIIGVLTCISTAKPVTDLGDLLWWKLYCSHAMFDNLTGVVWYVSSVLHSLVCVVCEMTISTTCVSSLRHTVWHVLKPLCHTWMCWRTQYCQCSCFFYLFLYCIGSYFHLVCLNFCLTLGGYWWLLWLNTSVNISGNSFSKVRRNLSHSNCIGSIWILYLLLICRASVLTWVIISLHFLSDVG